MLKAALTAAFALATVGGSGLSAESAAGVRHELAAAAHDGVVLTRAQISHIKAKLQLTPEQAQYWRPVENALRQMAGSSAHGVAMASQPIVLDQARVQRLAALAMPLLMTLREDQRRQASALARSMGLGASLAAF